MRKFVKTVAVLALAVSVLSTSAFAALSGTLTPNNDGSYTVSVQGAASGEQVAILAVDGDAVNTTGETPVLGTVEDGNVYYIDQAANGTFSNFQLKDGAAGKKIYFFAGSATSNAPVFLGNTGENVNIIDATVEEMVEANAGSQNGFGVSFKITEWDDSFAQMIWVFADDNDRYYSTPVNTSIYEGIESGSSLTINAAFYNGGTTLSRNIEDVDAIFKDSTGVEYFTDVEDASRRVSASTN